MPGPQSSLRPFGRCTSVLLRQHPWLGSVYSKPPAVPTLSALEYDLLQGGNGDNLRLPPGSRPFCVSGDFATTARKLSGFLL